MSDTSADGDDIWEDDSLIDDDNNSVRSSGSVSIVICEGPDLPNEWRSYWQDHTPLPELNNIDFSPDIPDRVDVAIIGSGMTAVGTALSFLQLMASKRKFPVVLVIEAGEICSGTTARNSGHIKFSPHVTTHYGRMHLHLQVKNAQALMELASRYPHAHAREFETEELFFHPEEFEVRKAVVADLNEQYPQYKVTILEGDEVPHRHMLRGTLQARHVVHATDSYATRLLPALEIALTAGWVHMLSQRPGASFPQREGKHSWTLNSRNHPFTVIRLPDRNDEIGDLLIERGWRTSGERDDREVQATVNYLHACMGVVFGPQWEWEDAEMTRKLWSATVGITGDALPFVGRIPWEYANREVLRSDQAAVEAAVSEDGGLATPGEWISAGYNGRGTAFALLSGHAVAIQIAGMEDEELEMVPGRPGGRLNDWFPKEELSLGGDRMVRANLGPPN